MTVKMKGICSLGKYEITPSGKSIKIDNNGTWETYRLKRKTNTFAPKYFITGGDKKHTPIFLGLEGEDKPLKIKFNVEIEQRENKEMLDYAIIIGKQYYSISTLRDFGEICQHYISQRTLEENKIRGGK